MKPMKRRGIDVEEGVNRRSFLKGALAAGTAGVVGAAGFGTVQSLIAPKVSNIVEGDLLNTFLYVREAGAELPQWYVEGGLAGQEARLTDFQPGRGASAIWKAIRDKEGRIVSGTGFPCLLMQWEDAELGFAAGFPRDQFVMQGLYAIFLCCTHLCCRPGWQLISRSRYRDNLGYDNVYCSCHFSQYNPRQIAKYTHPAPPKASGAEYVGIYKEPGVGPANRGMPLIPLELEGDKLVGVAKNPEWYRYLDFKERVLEAE